MKVEFEFNTFPNSENNNKPKEVWVEGPAFFKTALIQAKSQFDEIKEALELNKGLEDLKIISKKIHTFSDYVLEKYKEVISDNIATKDPYEGFISDYNEFVKKIKKLKFEKKSDIDELRDILEKVSHFFKEVEDYNFEE